MGIPYSHILYLTTCKYTVSCEKNKIKVNLFLIRWQERTKKGKKEGERGGRKNNSVEAGEGEASFEASIRTIHAIRVRKTNEVFNDFLLFCVTSIEQPSAISFDEMGIFCIGGAALYRTENIILSHRY